MQYGFNSCTDDRETNVEKRENKAQKSLARDLLL